MADILELGIDQQDGNGDESINVEKVKQQVRKRKGRGFTSSNDTFHREVVLDLDKFESLSDNENGNNKKDDNVKAQRLCNKVYKCLDYVTIKAAEGWILIVTGIHEEGHEEDVLEHFAEYGKIKSVRLDLDHRTGFLKGYALIEFENFKDAISAKNSLDGTELLGNQIRVEWAFMKKPIPALGHHTHRQQ